MEKGIEWTEDFGSTEGDVVIDVVFDVDILLRKDQVVDVFDFVDRGRRGCHITGAKWSVRRSEIIKSRREMLSRQE